MTYKYNKKEWVGFCDICGHPFQPHIVDASVYVVNNRKKAHFEIDLSKKASNGYCVACCKVEGIGNNLLTNIDGNIDGNKLIVRKVGKVLVV